ncbi:MAG: hypothetical protein KDB24_00965, partial [Microthrixaceae bacterium]|nr:hypothetical protein [Microthrixaceae bacterium]
HNAIRQHLAKLVSADLVEESVAAPNGRGRPRLQYSLAPGAESRWGVTGPYERLSMWLAEALATKETPVDLGRRIGRDEYRAGSGANTPVENLVAQMSRQGFEPTVNGSGDVVDIVLGECPFASAVLVSPDTVCGVHLGLAEGAAEAIGGIEVESLSPRDPRTANCVLRCRVVDDADPS